MFRHPYLQNIFYKNYIHRVVIQEALNNALKYSEATEIAVSISEVNDSINIAIKDNGIGFAETKVEVGNGLNNMKKRARELGANFVVNSASGEGTNIIMNLKKDKR